MSQIINQATAVGDLGGVTGVAVDSTIAITEFNDELSFTKTADKPVWYGGTLTYTLVIANNSATDAYTTPVITDAFEDDIAFMEGSVVFTTDDGATYNYDAGTNTLTLNLSTIPVGGSVTIQYQVVHA